HHPGGDAYLPPGMTVEQARKIQGQGPQVGPVGGGFGGGARQGGPAGAPGAPGGGPPQGGGPPRPQGIGYNSIFVGSKGYLGTSGRGEGVGLLPGARWAEYKLPAEYLPRSPGRAPAAITPRICAIGCARARAARPLAPTSASPGRTPNGWRSA